MFAVIVTGGKQYRVTAGHTIEVEKLEGNPGDMIKIEHVLAVSGDKAMIGSPTVANAFIDAQIVAQGKGDKVLIFKKKRRHNYRRKNGHRQPITTLYITGVSLNGQSLASVQPKSLEAKKAPAVSTKPAAIKKAAAAATPKTSVKPAAKTPAAAKKPAAKKAAK